MTIHIPEWVLWLVIGHVAGWLELFILAKLVTRKKKDE